MLELFPISQLMGQMGEESKLEEDHHGDDDEGGDGRRPNRITDSGENAPTSSL